MNSPAKFLLLLDDLTRALLFDSRQQFLGEVIEEDGFIVDSLLRGASECPRPDDDMMRSVRPPPAPTDRMRCFRLS